MTLKIKISRRRHPPFPGTNKIKEMRRGSERKTLTSKVSTEKAYGPTFIPLFPFIPQRNATRVRMTKATEMIKHQPTQNYHIFLGPNDSFLLTIPPNFALISSSFSNFTSFRFLLLKLRHENDFIHSMCRCL